LTLPDFHLQETVGQTMDIGRTISRDRILLCSSSFESTDSTLPLSENNTRQVLSHEGEAETTSLRISESEVEKETFLKTGATGTLSREGTANAGDKDRSVTPLITLVSATVLTRVLHAELSGTVIGASIDRGLSAVHCASAAITTRGLSVEASGTVIGVSITRISSVVMNSLDAEASGTMMG